MPDRDPFQSLWTMQDEEPFTMSLADIHTRAKSFQSRVRNRNALEYAASVFVVGIFTWVGFLVPEPVVKLGAALVALATLYVCWQLFVRARAAPGDAAMQGLSWADFHRAELVRQRDALRSVLTWYLAPFAPGMIVFVLGVAFAPTAGLPFPAALGMALSGLGFIAFVFGAVWGLNQWAARKIHTEIEALDRTKRGQQ